MLNGCKKDEPWAWTMLIDILEIRMKKHSPNIPEQVIKDLARDIIRRFIKGNVVNKIDNPGKFRSYCNRASINIVIDYERWYKHRSIISDAR